MKGGKKTRTEESFRRLLDSAPDAMVFVNEDGKIVLVNAQTEHLFGYARAELIGQSVEILLPERFKDQHVKDRRSYSRQPRVRPMASGLDLYARHKDGREFPVDISLSPLETEDGVLVASAIRDVTERKQAEAALQRAKDDLEVRVQERTAELTIANVEIQETRQYLERLIESSTTAIISTNKEGKVVLFNEGAEAMLGFQREEIIGQHVTLVYESVDRAKDLMRQMRKQGGKVSAFETTLRAKDGTPIPVMISASILYDAEGQEAGTVGFNKDLRERKQAEEALLAANMETQETRQYLERLIESATDAIISTDKAGNVVLFNEGAEAMLGFQRGEIIGQRVSVVYESMDRAKDLMRLMRKQGGTVSAFETTLRAKDGTPIPVMISASILYDEQGQEAGTVGFNKDLRPLKQAEEELRRAKAQIQALRIEIDQTKRITETDYFQDLEKKVEELRDRSTPEPA
jgi:PAS domain S-box-containing protein